MNKLIVIGVNQHIYRIPSNDVHHYKDELTKISSPELRDYLLITYYNMELEG